MNIYRNNMFEPAEKCHLSIHIPPDGFCQELHEHEFIEIELVLYGEGVQTINGQEYRVQTGDICFFALGDKHSYQCLHDLTILDVLIKPDYFYHELLGQENALLYLPSVIRLPEGEAKQLLDTMRMAMEEYDKKLVGYQTVLLSYVQICVALLFRTAAYSAVNPYNEMNEILTYLENHFATTKLSDVARMFNYSESYLSRLFKQHMGIPFSQYIVEKKMEKAISLVTFTDEKIENICMQVGYKDKTQFYKTFRNYTGTTPQKMRQQRSKFEMRPPHRK